MVNNVDQRSYYQDDKKGQPGLKIARVSTTYPDEVTLVLEGGKFALDLSIFEVPVSCYPLVKDDRFLVYAMATSGAATRYGVTSKLTNGQAMGTMQGPDSCLVDGMGQAYAASDLILPTGALIAGNRVTVTPTWSGDQIKYIVIKI